MKGEGISPNIICELRLATDLSLRAAKKTAKSIDRSMAALVATERHLWLNLSNIKGKDKNFLMLPFLPLASLAVLGIRLSRDFRNQLSKWLHSRNSSPAIFISPWLLSRSSPKHLKPAPPTMPHKSRAWLNMLPT